MSCVSFLLSSLLEQVDEITSKWSSPCLTVNDTNGFIKYIDEANQSNKISCQGSKQFTFGLQIISSFYCNLVWFIRILQLHDNKWMLFYFIIQYIEWSQCGYYNVFLSNVPVHFNSQISYMEILFAYLLVFVCWNRVFLSLKWPGTHYVAKAVLELMAILLPHPLKIWIISMWYHTPLRNAFEIMDCVELSPSWYNTIPKLRIGEHHRRRPGKIVGARGPENLLWNCVS